MNAPLRQDIVEQEALDSSVAVSASQIDTFVTCNRKWGIEKLLGIKPPPKASAELGKEMHGVAENYHDTGKSPDRLTKAGAMFVSGLPWVAPPKSGTAEQRINFFMDGVQFLGFIDYRGKNVPGWDPEARVTRDYKTSSAPDKYGLFATNKDYAHLAALGGSDEEIRKRIFLSHPQPVIYATFDVMDTGDDVANLDWLYFWSKGKERAKPNRVVLRRAELEDVFEKVVLTPSKQIVRLKMAPPPIEDLEPNPAVCNKYGGCPFSGKECKLSDHQQFAGMVKKMNQYEQQQEEKKQMNLLEKIKAQNSANGSSAASETKKSEAPSLAGTGRVNPPESRPSERPAARAVEKEEKVETKVAPKVASEKREDRPVPGGGSRATVAPDVSDAQLGAALRLLRDFMLGRIG